jgi:hypothetical protein
VRALDFRIVHIPREDNSEANWLAHHAIVNRVMA